jgi:hypothetical protein
MVLGLVLGLALSIGVGALLLSTLGSALGAGDGTRLGDSVGAWLGLTLGFNDGGVVVRPFVGGSVGLNVALVVGRDVTGATIGFLLNGADDDGALVGLRTGTVVVGLDATGVLTLIGVMAGALVRFFATGALVTMVPLGHGPHLNLRKGTSV